MKILTSLAITAALALGVPALAQTSTTPKAGATKMSQAECTTAWNKVDTAKSGSITQSQAQGVVKDFKAADTNNDGKLNQTEFMAACDKGLVTASAATGSGGRGMTGNEPSSSHTPGTSTMPGGSTAPKK
jgi:Spy/CpxP family protein refolding chaperone